MDYYTLTYDETKIKFPILVRYIKSVLYHYNDEKIASNFGRPGVYIDIKNYKSPYY